MEIWHCTYFEILLKATKLHKSYAPKLILEENDFLIVSFWEDFHLKTSYIRNHRGLKIIINNGETLFAIFVFAKSKNKIFANRPLNNGNLSIWVGLAAKMWA